MRRMRNLLELEQSRLGTTAGLPSPGPVPTPTATLTRSHTRQIDINPAGNLARIVNLFRLQTSNLLFQSFLNISWINQLEVHHQQQVYQVWLAVLLL